MEGAGKVLFFVLLQWQDLDELGPLAHQSLELLAIDVLGHRPLTIPAGDDIHTGYAGHDMATAVLGLQDSRLGSSFV
jgi:hypothetical protein